MSRILLGHDPLTGISKYHDYDPVTDVTTISHVGDCEPYLEKNKARANDVAFSKNGIKDGFWLYASIPPALQVKWLLEEGLDVYNPRHGDRLSRKLADPEFAFLKTTTRKHKFK